MKAKFELSLALSGLLLFIGNLSGASLASQTNVSNPSQLNNNQELILARPKLTRWQRNRAPRWRIIGGRRGSCLKSDALFIPVIPPDPDSEAKVTYHKSLWNTTTSYPTIIFYLSDNNFSEGELTLQNHKGETIYIADLKLPNQPGFIKVELPQFSESGSVISPLQVGESYRWLISIDCKDDIDPLIGGGIYRVDPGTIAVSLESEHNPVSLRQALNEAKQDDLPSIYQQASDWYNSLGSLAVLMESQPNNLSWQQQWHQLLADVGYENIADVTLIQSAEIVEVELAEED